MEAIRIEQLNKSYGDVHALKDISLTVNTGEIFGLIGPDGAGKSTLIRILCSLLLPDEGEAYVMGSDPVKDYKALRSKLGYMPGKFSLYQDLSIEENLNLFASIYDTTIEENYHLVEDIYVQIEPFKARRAGALSGGMKQKLALCCAMIHRPEILFLDEPTTGVDPVSRREFWEMLKKLNDGGLTIFVSTPYMDEASLCHRIALVQEGAIMAIDTPTAITQAFSYPLFEIKGENKYGILKALRNAPNTHSVHSFGSTLHYTDHRKDIDPKILRKELEATNLVIHNIASIAPNIEDTFIALMTSHGKN